MGYRSAVALVLSPKGVEVLNSKLHDATSQKSSHSTLGRLLKNADEQGEDSRTGDKFWYWEWIKWYPEYPEIEILEGIMSELADEEYQFIRLGEENTDIEQRGAYYNNPFGMDLRRSIVFDN